ncbi:hypothetical protein ACNPM4_19860 [Microbacterium sp. AGC62]
MTTPLIDPVETPAGAAGALTVGALTAGTAGALTAGTAGAVSPVAAGSVSSGAAGSVSSGATGSLASGSLASATLMSTAPVPSALHVTASDTESPESAAIADVAPPKAKARAATPPMTA